ncbi:MAG: hypothetical protein ACJ79B_03715 [Gemmatimonadaceae bacterium]
MVRLSLVLASLVNIAAGIGLGFLWFNFRHDEGMPIIVLLVALSLFVQGGFTIGHLNGLWQRSGLPSFPLFLTGEAAAALIGGIAILQGVLYNLQPVNGDYEFGPLLAATLMSTQATIGLVFAARDPQFGARRKA